MKVFIKLLIGVVALNLFIQVEAYSQETAFSRGDVNQDNFLDIGDPILVLLHLFKENVTAPCEKAADVDDSGVVDITDAIYELSFFYLGGSAPPPPFDRCGLDPTADALTCLASPCSNLEGTLVINEFVASNSEGLVDEDGDRSDWIEIHMPQSAVEDSIDLGGWYLTGNPDDLLEWQFPQGITLNRGDYLVVFASGKNRRVNGQELHTNFRLNDNGEYLALVAPDGLSVVDEFSPEYPQQLLDISYGLSQSTQGLISTSTAVKYRIPTSGDSGIGLSWTQTGFNDASWLNGLMGIGFTGVISDGFDVTYIKANTTVGDLSQAINVINTPGLQSQVVQDTASFIDFFNTGGRGNYANDIAFPGQGFNDINDFVLEAEGAIIIPSAGNWSFGVNSDDGFSLDITGHGQNFSMSHPQPRGPADTIQAFNFPQAGVYDVRLVFYERGGGAGCELFAAQGNISSFNPSDFKLVGDTANGGLALAGLSGEIETDVGSSMQGTNATIWVRIPFNVNDVNDIGALNLHIKYEDGFEVFLNGTSVTDRNAPASLSWNSSATQDRPIEDVTVVEDISLTGSIGLLQNGTNVLAIQGLNDTASDADFLISAELVARGRSQEYRYMTSPTPGAINAEGFIDYVRDVEFSVESGYFSNSFSLALTTETGNAEIRYTLNGDEPTSSTGIVYSNPITISSTSVLRVKAFKQDYLESNLTSSSYLFPSDIKLQSPAGQAPGPGWPTGSVNGQVLDYGMDPDIVNDARWSGDIENAFFSIPAISVSTDIDNLMGASQGIHVNARNDGRAWERPVSVDVLYPDGKEGVSVNAGLRIRGAFSRSDNNPKHSFRLYFRREYGAGRLKHSIHGGEGTDDFDKLDLRTAQNYSWAFSGSNQNTFMREVFSRDTMRDMRSQYTRSIYFHLFLNGHYWGLFQTEERVDEEFAQTYLGGDDLDYDIIKNDSSGNRALQASAGTMDAYRRLYDAAVAGFSSNTAYLAVLGLDSNGNPDPNGEHLVDKKNLMDYMACTYYTGDPDAPISAWAHFSNNIFAIYDRVNPDGFKFYRHDAEHSLGANGGLHEARLLTDPTDRAIGQDWNDFNPAWLHLRLTGNAEYALEFADVVNRYFHHGGVLSGDKNLARWNDRASQIDLAVIAASARWGDSKTHPPKNRDDWLNEINWMRNTYFPQRTQIVLNQMRSVNMFPDEGIVSFNQHGGHVSSGFQVSMSQGNGVSGDIYFTTDGNDPREWGGSIHPSASIFSEDSTQETLIPRGSLWKFYDQGDHPGATWDELSYNDNSWGMGPAELGYGDGGEPTEVSYGPDINNKYITTYFRHEFSVADASAITQLTLGIVRDDGAAVYINGTEAIPRINLPAGALSHTTVAQGPGVPVGNTDETTFFPFDVDPNLLVDGQNIIAVEIHQASATSSDISFNLDLVATVAGGQATQLSLTESTTIKARLKNGNNWGAMTEARFLIGVQGLVINEIMASNSNGFEDPDEPGENPDWIELYNGSGQTIDLGGMYLSDDPLDLTQWKIPQGVSIQAGEHLIIIADDDGTQGPTHTNYQLSGSGEEVLLVARDAMTVIDSIQFDEQTTDVSYGRFPDGTGDWGFHTSDTPGGINSGHQ